ncbi:MAG TPA: hypothetical protein VLX92_26535 [Kofleriaceae bacterium]|nr:hypothetical protein [Kofleriaceae bacterium]
MLRALALVLLAAAACATTSQQGPQVAASGSGSGSGSGSDDDNMVCREVEDTGSLFSHRECVPREDAKLQHDETERYMEKPRNMTTNAH